MKTLATVPAYALAACSIFQAVKDVRFYLRGTLIESHEDGLKVCATNGHALLELATVEGQTEQTMILEVPKAARAKLKAAGKALAVVEQDDEDQVWITVTANGGQFRFATVIHDARFPDVNAVIPRTVPENPAPVSPVSSEMVGNFADVAKVLKPKGAPLAIAFTPDPSDLRPHCVQFGAVDGLLYARGVLMPMKADTIGQCWPTKADSALRGVA